ncbi:MAG: hypothetical protein AAEJ04_00630 [Planctomycetota bacterium]
MTSSFMKPMKAFGSVIFLLLFFITATISVADDRPLTPRSVPKFGGTEVAQRVETMFSGLQWHGDFDDAMARAAEEGKPLFWLQVVGKLDGGL